MNVPNKIELIDVLYEVDPAGTNCRENMMYDEYKFCALGILTDVDNGTELEDAIKENLEFYFLLDSSEFQLDTILGML